MQCFLLLPTHAVFKRVELRFLVVNKSINSNVILKQSSKAWSKDPADSRKSKQRRKMSENVQKFLRMLPEDGLLRGFPISFEPNH